MWRTAPHQGRTRNPRRGEARTGLAPLRQTGCLRCLRRPRPALKEWSLRESRRGSPHCHMGIGRSDAAENRRTTSGGRRTFAMSSPGRRSPAGGSEAARRRPRAMMSHGGISTPMRADLWVRGPGRRSPSVSRSLEARADRHAASELAPAPRADPFRVHRMLPRHAVVPPSRTGPAARPEAACSRPPSGARVTALVRPAPPSLSRARAPRLPLVRPARRCRHARDGRGCAARPRAR